MGVIMDNWQHIINLLGMAAVGAVGWFSRQLWDSVQNLKEDIHRIELELPSHYVRKDEIETKLDKIDARFDRLDAHITKLFDKLEQAKGL